MPSTTKADSASRKHEDRVLLERYRRTGDSQLRDELVRVDQIADELTQALERSPTTAELSEAAGINEEELLEVFQARSARGAISLQALVGNGAGSGTLEDWIGHHDGGIEAAETHAVLAGLLRSLSARERDIVRMRFKADMTQAEIGEVIGVSQMQISRIIRQALQRLRAAAGRQSQLAAQSASIAHASS